MNLIVTGISHRTAPVEVRERMYIQPSRLRAALSDLVSREGILEAMILSTCNRVEVIANAETGLDPEAPLRAFLASYHHSNLASYEQHLYWLRQGEAVEHLFRVAASLDSMILGEPQILGQVRQAYALALEAGAMRGELQQVVNYALAAAKRVRRETAIGSAAISVSYAAVELARKIFGSLDGKVVFILGAGKMSELAARHLNSGGASTILVSNRTYQRAAELARELRGEAIPFDEIFHHLHKADIVISSTGAPHFLLGKSQVEEILACRKNRPIFFVDIAVPRDVDPAVNELDNAFVYDIDDLEQVVTANKKQREEEAVRAEQILTEEAAKMMRRLDSRELAPAIAAIEGRLNRIREEETERFRGRLAGLTPEQREAVDSLTRGILNKILHGPVTELKNTANHSERGALVQMIRKIFGVT
ncbi:MAG: glutamyl-tRNA reductase [Terriglobia bacterium]